MIVIDGEQSKMDVAQFSNLEEILVNVMGHKDYQERVLTDVLVNDENFTEIYPHQSEDVASSEISKLEIKTTPVSDLAINITRELYKVVRLMREGAKQVSELFRVGDDGEALEVYQDLLEVTRDFLGMVGLLRDEFTVANNEKISLHVEELSSLFSEILEVQENEDWILLSDLLEYEFLPIVDRWKEVIAQLRESIRDNNQE